MVLEATIIVLDNSEWMRNGDYLPTRLDAQNDAINLLFSAKTQSNPENTVGVMTMGGKTPEVLVTLTNDLGKILSAVHKVRLEGKAHFSQGIQVAQLALKHRQNKTQRQRIIVFVGSPIEEDDKSLVKLGKKLKKNNVALDIVNFGEESSNTAKLEAFVEAVSSSDNSHLVTIPPGPNILSDVLISSAIVAGEGGVVAAGGTTSSFEFGVDPNLDPELALALRISMEEERARQQATSGAGDAAGNDGTFAKPPANDPMAVEANPAEDAELAKALALSMGKTDGDVQMGDAVLDEDAEMARAIAMSMESAQKKPAAGAPASSSVTATPQTNNTLANILGNLPGVDPNDPRVQEALRKKDGKPSTETPGTPSKKPQPPPPSDPSPSKKK